MAMPAGSFLSQSYDVKEGTMKIDINNVPQLDATVGAYGSVSQQEVAGPLCLAVFLGGVVLYVNRPDSLR